MKKTFTLLCLISIFLKLDAQNFGERIHNKSLNFHQIQNEANTYFNEKYFPNASPTFSTKSYNGPEGLVEYQKIDGEYAKYKRWEWYWQNRIMPDSSFPNLQEIYGVKNTTSTPLSSNFLALKWKNINQTNATGGYNGMGRTTAVVFHPTDQNTYYVGAPIGGIWKTTNGGNTYQALGDNLPYTSVGNIIIDPKNADILYISIGDHLGWWNFSLGIYKSTDGGKTWNPTVFTKSFNDQIAIYKLAISPTNSNIIMCAASDGLYRSGDAGVTWQKIRSGEHKDVKFHPINGDIIFTAFSDWWSTSEVYKSTDAGLSFTSKTNLNSLNNSIILAVSPIDPNIVCFLTRKDNAFYLSTDGGENFNFKSVVPETDVLYASSTSKTTFYCGGINIYNSVNNGVDWKQQTIWHGSGQYPEVHADQHFITHSPITNELYFCNDGGVYKYNENTKNWTERSNGLIITQFYRIALAQTNQTFMIGGTQDNGGRKRKTDGTWTATNGGDAMEVAIDPRNENVFYTSYTNGTLYRTRDAWVNDTYKNISNNIIGTPEGNWVTPFLLDHQNPNRIVAGYQDVYSSLDQGDTWKQLSFGITGSTDNKLECIEVSKRNSNHIYASYNQNLYITKNNGANWSTYTFTGFDKITSITTDYKNSNLIYCTFGGYKTGKKVMKSSDGGISWTNISGLLPNVPANALTIDSLGLNALYVGTDLGVYYQDDNSGEWSEYGSNLPNSNVTDLEIQKSSGTLRIATYGRGVWEIPLWSKATHLVETDPIPAKIIKGIRFIEYKGLWNNLPDFTNLKSIAKTHGGIQKTLDISTLPISNDSFAVKYSTFLYAPIDGVYTFYLTSSDGSVLKIGQDTLINHDGVHGIIEKTAFLGLKKGFHNFNLNYFQSINEKDLKLEWEGPDFSRKDISTDLWIEEYKQEIPSTFSTLSYQKMYGLHANNTNTLLSWVEKDDYISYVTQTNNASFYRVELNYASVLNNRIITLYTNNDSITTTILSSTNNNTQETSVIGIVYLNDIDTLTLKSQTNNINLYSLNLIKSDCNGDENGQAILDSCNICTGGNTGKTKCVITDVEKDKTKEIMLYPNPTEGNFKIEGILNYSLTIKNLNGNTVFERKNINSSNIETNLQTGIYIIEIQDLSRIIVSKLFVK